MKTITVIPYRPGLRDEHEELLPDFRRLLLESADSEHWCLDLGTGEGRVAFEIAPHVRWVLGIDKNSRRIEEARRIAQNRGVTNAQFIVGDVERMVYSDMAPTGNFQLVTTNLCLSEEVIRLIPETLERGGHLVGTCFESHNWLETGRVSRHAWSEDRLLVVLKANGFEVLNLDVVGNVIQFDSLEQLEKEYLPTRLRDRWQTDGRWSSLTAAFARGNRTLTESRIVFNARMVK